MGNSADIRRQVFCRGMEDNWGVEEKLLCRIQRPAEKRRRSRARETRNEGRQNGHVKDNDWRRQQTNERKGTQKQAFRARTQQCGRG